MTPAVGEERSGHPGSPLKARTRKERAVGRLSVRAMEPAVDVGVVEVGPGLTSAAQVGEGMPNFSAMPSSKTRVGW